MFAAHLQLYELLGEATRRLGGFRRLRDAQRDVPRQGVYFFLDERESRLTGEGPRVVRVGTHAVSDGSRTTLRTRLGQHRGVVRGANPGGGNHRGSVFRLHIGNALMGSGGWDGTLAGIWAVKQARGFRAGPHEQLLERAVSDYIRSLPVIWVPVPDEAGLQSARATIERGAISLLSNRQQPLDPPSPGWLGLRSPEPKIRRSGLWNVNHVDDPPSLALLEKLETAVVAM